MLNRNVVNVLHALNSITNSAILRYPTTVLNNTTGDIVVKLNVKALDETPFEDFGIYNLSEFLSTFKLFEKYDVVAEPGLLNIKGENSTLEYLITNTAVLENHNKSENLFTSTEDVPTVASFSLSKEDVKMIKSAAGVFKDLTDIILESRDGDIMVKLGSSNNFNAKSNSYSVKKEANTSKEFSIKIPAENFNTLPTSDYNFEVKYNEPKNAYRILINSTEIDMTILMAIKK
jgi:hypothetical protein